MIGDRQLVCVQLFDIARHPSAAVVFVPGCFVAVTGKGPEDSNESGKTSWLASVSLLLGDPEWRMYGPGPAAVAQLLFEPDTAGVPAQRYPAATFGFIAGVFADPEDVLASAHTVWMRISSTAPYVQVRHGPGVRLATSHDDEERHRAAPGIFKSLPGPALGAVQYAERLYGPVPRCLAYLTSRGKHHGGPSLLKLETGQFTPAGIGSALIDLTGRAHLLETDQAVRRDLARETAQLAGLEHENANALAQEEQALLAIEQRDKARRNLSQARDFWRLHYARGLLDVLDEQHELSAAGEKLRPMLAEAERAVSRAREDLASLQDTKKVDQDWRHADEKSQRAANELDAARDRERLLKVDIERTQEQIQEAEREAAGAHGSLDDARQTAAETRMASIESEVRRTAAEDAHTSALRDLEQAEKGHYGQAGRTVEILAAAGIDAVGLLDGLDIPPSQRSRWEARLSLYRDAVCIDAEQADRATHELAAFPGAVLVLRHKAPSARSPAFAPPPLRPFLHALAQRLHNTTDPCAALDDELGLRILGGFPQPITGRQVLLEHLHCLATQAEDTLRTTAEAVQRAHAAQADADLNERRLEHAQRAIELRARRQTLETELTDIAPQVQRLQTAAVEAARVREEALVKQRMLVLQRKEATRQRDEAKSAQKELLTRDEELSRQRAALNIEYWTERAGGPDQARAALHLPSDGQHQAPDAPQPERRSEISLREVAGRYLQQAIADLGIDLISGTGAPNPTITRAVQVRANQADEEGSRQFVSAEAFERPADAIQDWLDTRADSDRGTRSRVAANREEREVALAAAQQTVADLNQSVRATQDSIALRLDQALQDIEDALDRLNRGAGLYGAELRRTLTPPATVSDIWRCEITPHWRRTPTGHMLPYNNITNAAQEKLFSVHLVLAALLASPHARGRVLILDELGDALGYHHRREVLDAIAGTSEEYGISVLGTCQDALTDDAADFYGGLLYFHYPSHTEALNTATRTFGYDENNERVELTLDALLAGRTLW
ncbi:hypothetical protein [Streptomyces sp. NPDC001933]|uniref:hypothetical protein n=1 Tax=Streptomyces sp. NPDC001933 TaxID=3364626 RepID=UPI0036BD5B3A